MRAPGTLLLLSTAGCLRAPSLVVVPPAEIVRGPVELQVQSDARWIEIEANGVVKRVEPGTVVLDPLPDGETELTVRAGGWPAPTKTVQARVRIDNTAPRIELSSRSHTVEQGHTLPFVFRTDEPATVTLTWSDRERPLYPIGERTWRALIGVPIREEPGTSQATLTVRDALGNEAVHTVPIEVTAVEWPFTGTLQLSKKAAAVSDPEIEKMRSERDPIYAEHTDTALWKGPLRVPTEGTHTSFFGSYREYPDGHRSHHDAQDIAKRKGTPVYAANAGVVRLARAQAVHGNAILLGHGQGVVTLYSHLDRFEVAEGDVVAAGDRLGDMGSTGRSTGPHLHWGVVVDHVPVDPMQWTEVSFDPDAFEPFEPLAD